MKNRVLTLMTGILFLSSFTLAAEEVKKEKGWSFSSVTDFAWYPESDFVAGGSHFAPVTGVYSKTEFRTTIHAKYTLPVPFNDNMLFSGNTIVFDTALELTPLSVMPEFSVSVTPVAFFNFSAGCMAGSAWQFSGVHGLAGYDSTSRKYNDEKAFQTWLYKTWLCSTFMFDTAAVWPGKWHHIIAVASYELNYTGLINESNSGDIWEWQGYTGEAQGWKYDTRYILGYQLPAKLSLTGIQMELSGHLHGSDYGSADANYNGSFMTVQISPFAQITCTASDSLFIAFGFADRRSFKEKHSDSDEEPLLTYSGREWFFNRIALSWTHIF